MTRGDSRDHRPDLNQVMLELIGEHQAGIPVLMTPLSGNSSEAQDCGKVVRAHIDQLYTPYGTTYLVADSALSSAENLQKLSQTHMKWITRVPATLREAHKTLAQADPQTMTPLQEGYRSQTFTSTYGGVEQGWMVMYSESRRSRAQHPVDKQWRKQSDQDLTAFKKRCRIAFACEADAWHALADFVKSLQATVLSQGTIRAITR